MPSLLSQLMFNNCRQYNEEGSLIYEDANTLEKVLMDKVKELGPLPDTTKSKSTASTPTRNVGYVLAFVQNVGHAGNGFLELFFSLSPSLLSSFSFSLCHLVRLEDRRK